MTIFIFTISTTFLCLSAIAAEPVRVFLFAGQSNMEGADTDPNLVETFPPFRDALRPVSYTHLTLPTNCVV